MQTHSLDAVKNKYKTRKKKAAKDKMSLVMHEYGAGRLRSSSGQIVTNRRQAIAIGISESKRHPFKR